MSLNNQPNQMLYIRYNSDVIIKLIYTVQVIQINTELM